MMKILCTTFLAAALTIVAGSPLPFSGNPTRASAACTTLRCGGTYPYYSGPLYYNVPNPSQCTYDSTPGTACNGWNYWDYSRVDFSGSGAAYLGFIFDSAGAEQYKYVSGSYATRTVAWNDPDFLYPTHYNRALSIGSFSTYSQVAAYALIF